MESIHTIKLLSMNQLVEEKWRDFWDSVIVAREDEEATGGSKKAHTGVFLGSPVGSDTNNNAEIIQRKSNNDISHIPPAQLRTFTNYIKKQIRGDVSIMNLPSISDVSSSIYKHPIRLINANGDDEYSTKVELKKEDLENVISLNIHNCSLKTPIGSKKMKNLRLLWLENSLIHNNDVFQVESSELKELHVYECEIQFKIMSLFQNKFNCMDSLLELYLDRNQLSQVPDGVFQFRNLIKLSLNNNLLTQLPDKFFKLPKLKELLLSNNQLQYLPSSLLSLKLLKRLNISHNNFVFDINELATGRKNVLSLKELSYRTILKNKLVIKKEEELPKSLRETLANPQQCLCGSKFIEGQAVSFRYNLKSISNFLRVEDHNYVARFPIRGVICNSSMACSSFLYQNVEMNSLLRYLKLY